MDEQLDRYLDTVRAFLAEPTMIRSLHDAGFTVDMTSLMGPLYDAFGVLRPIERYEHMTEADKQWLRDMGIQP